MTPYLLSSEYIDWNSPQVLFMAERLAKACETEEAIARTCFEWVRDQVKHSLDYQLNPVTIKASETARHMTGFCYAKSHLLAALLRANRIPAGLCYQRLQSGENAQGEKTYCLHGLTAAYLKNYGWIRLDARGNKEGINAQFDLPQAQLAFTLQDEQEADLPEIWAEPLGVIVHTLTHYDHWEAVVANLPDVQLLPQ